MKSGVISVEFLSIDRSQYRPVYLSHFYFAYLLR